jgi:RNA polymerase sigma-70 factor (ECF subfamily)
MRAEKREAELTARARQGDREAFGDLYELYLEELYRYVFYRINHKEDTEDLTEQVFLRAWASLPGYRGEVPFKSWIYRIARNAVVDHYRARKPEVALEEQALPVDGDNHPQELALAQETRELLAEAISRLSALHQDVLIMRFINGLSTEETARILERNVGTIRVLQHRALKGMKSYLVAGEIING